MVDAALAAPAADGGGRTEYVLQPRTSHVTFNVLVTPAQLEQSAGFLSFVPVTLRRTAATGANTGAATETVPYDRYVTGVFEYAAKGFVKTSVTWSTDSECASEVKLDGVELHITRTGACHTAVPVTARFGAAVATQPVLPARPLVEVQGFEGVAVKVVLEKHQFVELIDGTDILSVRDDANHELLTHVRSAQFSVKTEQTLFVVSSGADVAKLRARVRVLKAVEADRGVVVGVVTAGDLYDLAFPDTIIPDVLRQLRDNARKESQQEPWRSRSFHLWRAGGKVFFDSTKRLVQRVFNLVRLAYLGGDVAAPLREILIYVRTLTEDSVSAQEIHSVMELRGTDALCNSGLFRAPLQDKGAVLAEIERQRALPVSQRNGMSLMVYAWESMNQYIDEDKSNPCTTAARIAGSIGTDGCNLERGTYVACVACVLDASLRGTARALAQCTPVDFGPSAAAPVYIHTRRVVSVFVADACDARIKVATERALSLLDQHPWRALALLRSVGTCVYDLALACGRSVRCEGAGSSALTDQVRAADATLGTQFERAVQLAESYGFVPTLIREVAHRVLTAKMRVDRAYFALPPQAPPELAHAQFLAGMFHLLDVQADGSPKAATSASVPDAFICNLLVKGGAANWPNRGTWPGQFARIPSTDSQTLAVKQAIINVSNAPAEQVSRISQTPAYAADQVAQALIVARGCIDSAVAYVQNGARGSGSATDLTRMLEDAATGLFVAAHRAVVAAFVSGTATQQERVYIEEFESVYPDSMSSVIGSGAKTVQVTLTNDDRDMFARQLLSSGTQLLGGYLNTNIARSEEPRVAAPSSSSSRAV